VPSETDLLLPEAPLQNLLALLMPVGTSTDPYPMAVHPSQGFSPPHHAGIDWNLFEANEHTRLDESPEQRGVALIAQDIIDRFEQLSANSMDELEERSDVEPIDGLEPVEAVVAGLHSYLSTITY
jgi:hypothetical protein